MSQEESRRTATLPPEEPTPVDPEVLVTTYADDLITELFDDVDRILDGDEAALAAAEASPANGLTTMSFGKRSSTITPVVETTAETVDSTIPQPDGEVALTPLGSEIDFFSADDVKAEPLAQPKTRFGKLFDRLLLSITALSLMGVGGLLWFNQYGPGGRLSPNATTSQSNEEFLTYLQRSLEVISGKVERGEVGNALDQPPSEVLSSVTPPMLPPLGAGGTVGSLGSGPVNVIERVYIPYQTTQQPTASPYGLVPQVPTAAAPSPVAPGAAPQAAVPAPMHALMGVLELGDRSAALFEINGVSQRVYIGERIGSSDWSLVSVTNEEAVIRRNGEVRSIYIGQRF